MNIISMYKAEVIQKKRVKETTYTLFFLLKQIHYNLIHKKTINILQFIFYNDTIYLLVEILANSTSLIKTTDLNLSINFVKISKKLVVFCLSFDGVMDT